MRPAWTTQLSDQKAKSPAIHMAGLLFFEQPVTQTIGSPTCRIFIPAGSAKLSTLTVAVPCHLGLLKHYEFGVDPSPPSVLAKSLMLNTTRASTHTFTPSVTAMDSRGLAVRTIQYYRDQAVAPAQARISHQKYDLQGRLWAAMDARLGQLADLDPMVPDNLTSCFSLSAATLFSTSVDSGWRLTLFNEAGESMCSWDSRGHFRQQTHDRLSRLVTLAEKMPEQPLVVLERLSYGLPDSGTAYRNQCGRLIRHEDPVGSVMTTDFGLSGLPIVQTRRFTHSLLPPDWPLEESERERLLEPQAFKTRWQLSALSERLQQIDARQNIQRNFYDLAGNLKQTYLQINGAVEKPVAQFIGYNVDDQIEREVSGNGVITTARYDDSNGRLIHLLCTASAQRPLQSLRYEYDPVGNVVEVDDEAAGPVYFRNQRVERHCTYSYDSLSQLIWSTGFEAIHTPDFPLAFSSAARDPAQVANYREDYQYDEAGNLHTLVHAGGNQYTRHLVTAIHSNRSLPVYDNEVPGEPEITAGFDPNGNSRVLLRGQDLEWDGRNQLHRVTPISRLDGENDSEVYGYDSQGQRLRKSTTRLSRSGSVVREVRYLPGVEFHTDSNTGKAYQIVQSEGGLCNTRVMLWDSEPPSGMEKEHWCYSLRDHLGSSTLEMSQAAEVISQERFLPYGGTAWWVDNGSAEASYKTVRYSGKERDASGLYYYGFRYYAPWLQRWINPDPGGSIDGLNFYRFVRNNPLTLNDTNGLSPPVNLMYGFDEVRSRVLPRFGQAKPDQSVITIDMLNNELGIFGVGVEMDYLGVMTRIGNGIVVEDNRAKDFVAESRYYQGTVNDAKVMLQSWSDYLKKHISSLNIVQKIERLQVRGKSSEEFWKKNSKVPMSSIDIHNMTGRLQADPEGFFSPGGGNPAAAYTAVAGWFMRQTSKMGLDWFAETGSKGSIVFLDVGLEDIRKRKSDWTQLEAAVLGSKLYKTNAAIGEAFEPITYSERRYLGKQMEDPFSMLAKKTQILSLVEVRSFLK